MLSTASCAVHCLVSVSVFALVGSSSNSQDAAVGTTMRGTIRSMDNMALASAILLVNTPQVLLSGIYLSYNALFTCMSLAVEWVSYSRYKKGLRVSRPEGEQRSTYFLSLPYKYSIPLIIKSMLLHWVLSQSIFVYQVIAYVPNPIPSIVSTMTSVGVSTMGFGILALLEVVLILISVMLGFRKLGSGMPLARSNSLTISAACHRREDREQDLSTKEIQYGVISELPSGKYRIGFSNSEVRPLVPGEFYE